jgi:integrase
MPQPKQDKHGYWFGDITHNKKRTRKWFGKGVKGKRLAEHWCAKMTIDRNNKKMGLIEEMPAEQFFAQYVGYAKANKAEQSYDRDLITIKHFLPVIKNKKISEVTTKDIELYKSRRLKKVKKATVNRELNTIIAVFNKAVEWGNLIESPLKSVKKFKEPKKLPRFFSAKEIEKILNSINVSNQPQLKQIIYFLLHTGLRREELAHIEWDDVNLKEGSLYVQPKHDWTPKDNEGRTIPINSQLRKLLLSLPREGKYVFDSGNDKFYYKLGSLSRSFTRLLKRIEIKNASLHTLRHTYASHLVMAGVDLATVQKLLGHSQITTTMRYAHLAPGHLQEAAEKLNGRFCHFSDIEKAEPGKTGQIIKFKNHKKTNK